MNTESQNKLMTDLSFPREAVISENETVKLICDRGCSDLLDDSVTFFLGGEKDYNFVIGNIKKIAEKTSSSTNKIWLIFVLEGALVTEKKYEEKGISRDIFISTFEDIRYKIYECKIVYGEWGIFVPEWYIGFFNMMIFKIGRLAYEKHGFTEESFTSRTGYSIKKDDPAIWIHIPSSGESFDRGNRLRSMRRAYEFFGYSNGEIMPCLCMSWLLYSEYKEVFSGNTNIASFRNDFEMIFDRKDDEFLDIWRIFGVDHMIPTKDMKKDTALQRGFIHYINNGGTFGEGCGIILFNGSDIIN